MEFHYRSSTPNSPNHPFWQYILLGDQTRAWVKCPHCREYYYFDFIGRPEDIEEYQENTGIKVPSDYKSLVWDDVRDKKGQWDEGKVYETTRYICPHNGCETKEVHKQQMIEGCEEKRHNLLAAPNRRSFIIPSFYSPTMSFGKMGWAFLESLRDFFGLQDYYNSRLARPWQEFEVSVKLQDVDKCVGAYTRGTVPFDPKMLMLCVDPGELQTHWEVVAIHPEGGLFVIDWGTVLASREVISKDFLRARIYPIMGTSRKSWPLLGYMDSGYLTETQYDICQASQGFLWPTKGSEAKHGGVNQTKAASRPDLNLYTYPDKQAKDELYDVRLVQRKNGGIHFPSDADAELKLGHSGQKRDNKGQWKRVANDHYGDCSKLGLVGLWNAQSAGLL